MSELLGSWIDGVAGDSIPIADRGLQYGDGLFETILIRSGRPRFIDAHLARLTLGCSRLGIPAQLTNLRAQIDMAASSAPPLAILKLILTRGSAIRRGYAPQGEARPRRVMSLFAAPPAPPGNEGVSLRIASLRLSESPALAGLKHLNRLENVLAASEPGHENSFDAVLLSERGDVIGGTMSNIFAVQGARLVTPLVDRCGVAGVMRAIVIRECAALGIAVEQRRFSLDELLKADAVFVTNARIGVVPVRDVGEHDFAMNELTTRLAGHVGNLDA